MIDDPPRLKDSAEIGLGDVLDSARLDEPRDDELSALGQRLLPLFAPPAGPPGPPSPPGLDLAPHAGAASAGAKGLTAWKVASGAALLIAVASGAVVYATHDPVHDAPHDPAAGAFSKPLPGTAAAPGPIAPAPADADALPPPASSSSVLLAPRSPRTGRGAPAPSAHEDSADERLLVENATSALVARDAKRALALASEHRRRFPAGAHAEDRDRIAIEALVRLGRGDEARRAASQFFVRHPRSAYRLRIEALLEGMP